MVLGVPIGELLWLAAAIVAAGVVTGILAGLFGIGGGAVIIPALYEAFRILGVPEDFRMQLCIGTSMAIIVPTSIRSYLVHRARGLVLGHVMKLWVPPAVIGVGVGAAAAAFAPAYVFKTAFAVITGLLAARLLLGNEKWRLGADLPGRAAMTAYGFGLGLLSSLMGVSGGSMSVAILTLYGRPIHNAIATSVGLGVPITIAGTIGYMLAGLSHQAALPPLSIGFVSLIAFAVMAPVSSFVASYGAHLAHRLSRRRLETAFGLFLLAVSARFLIGALV